MPWIIAQVNGKVYGVGETRDEAISHATSCGLPESGQPLESCLATDYNSADGSLVMLQCTEALSNRVKEQGRDIAFAVENGVAMTLEEVQSQH